jgi:uncharacterized protein (TIGR03083 family)
VHSQAWITTERLRLADQLAELTPEQWRADSLCAGWTAHDVAGHLALATRFTLRGVFREMVRARFDFDRMEDRMSRAYAARFAPDVLVAQLRETADSPKRMPGAGVRDPLVDVLVHGQDILRPLGIEYAVPVEPGLAALEHAVDSAFYGRRTAGTRLVAVDADWTHGAGPEVRGTVGDLLLATGRKAVDRAV